MLSKYLDISKYKSIYLQEKDQAVPIPPAFLIPQAVPILAEDDVQETQETLKDELKEQGMSYVGLRKGGPRS